MPRSRKIVKRRKSSAKRRFLSRANKSKRSSFRLSSVSKKRMMFGGLGGETDNPVPSLDSEQIGTESLQTAINELTENIKTNLANCREPEAVATTPQPTIGGFGFSHLKELSQRR